MPNYDDYQPITRSIFASRDEANEAMRYWLFTDLELALEYQELVECRSQGDMHHLQREIESRDLTLDDLEEILSDLQQ